MCTYLHCWFAEWPSEGRRRGGGGRGGRGTGEGLAESRAMFVHKIVPTTLCRLFHCAAPCCRELVVGEPLVWRLRSVSRVGLDLDLDGVTPFQTCSIPTGLASPVCVCDGEEGGGEKEGRGASGH